MIDGALLQSKWNIQEWNTYIHDDVQNPPCVMVERFVMMNFDAHIASENLWERIPIQINLLLWDSLLTTAIAHLFKLWWTILGPEFIDYSGQVHFQNSGQKCFSPTSSKRMYTAICTSGSKEDTANKKLQATRQLLAASALLKPTTNFTSHIKCWIQQSCAFDAPGLRFLPDFRTL